MIVAGAQVPRHALLLAASLVALSTASAGAQTGNLPYQNATLTPEARAHDLVSRMTLEEKAEQGINTAPAITRLGVPAYDYWSEGLHGIARSGYSTLFPQAIGMAATWDAPLLQSIGDVVSTEARAKYNDAVAHDIHSIYFGLTIWSPNINIFRDPRWGRGQETYGEDPFLTGTLGQHFVEGMQGPDPTHPRAIATPKHFAVHSGPESERHRFNVDPSAHDLWDTYLPQFRMAIVDGRADSIMCAYNSIEGKPACGSDLLLKQVLRQDWGFKGFVTSDCGAIDDFFEKTAHAYSPDAAHASALAVKTGTDTNCGNTYKALPEAVKQGLVTEAEINTDLERLFAARFRLGLFDAPSANPYMQIPFSANRTPEHLALSQKSAEEAMVLLKNDGILPLQPGKYKTVAILGPNAASLSALEGNYNAIPKNPEMPVDALRAALRGARVVYSQGAPYAEGLSLPVPPSMLRPAVDSQENGLKGEYFAARPGEVATAFTGQPVSTRLDHLVDFDWDHAAPVDGVQQNAFAVRWTGFLVPPEPGAYDFSVRLTQCYPCNDHEHVVLKVDGKPLDEVTTGGGENRSTATPHFHVDLAGTAPHPVEITYTHDAPLFGGGLTLEWTPSAALLAREAARTIQQADLVISMVGLSPELEGEEMPIHVPGFAGGDRTDVQLPAAQADLLKAVAASGKPSVTVLLNGSALAVDTHANAILEAWYPGEFGGKAIARTLTGANNPAGRLPVTFYTSLAELPAFTDYSMKNRTYRYFNGTPLFGFGYGLSYSHFTYDNLKLSTAALQAGAPLTADVEITNRSSMAGDEVAECYLLPPAEGNGGLSPKLQLIGFQRVSLAPGEHRTVHFALSPRQLSEVDANGNRSVQAGSYELSIGGSQPNDPHAVSPAQRTRFTISGSAALAH